MRLQPLIAAALLIGGLVPNARADADSLNDYLGAREIAVGEAARGDARGAQAITMNPAGLALSKELVFEGGFGYRHGDGAAVASVSACDSTVPMPGCFYYRYFRAEPEIGGDDFSRRAHEGGLVLARPLGQYISLGTTTRYFDYNSDLSGEEDTSGWGVDAGVAVRPSNIVSIGVVGYNVVSADSAQYPRGVGAGVTLRPSKLSVSVDGLWNIAEESDSSGRYGGGAEYFLSGTDGQAGYPIRLGGVYDAGQEAGYLTGGLGYQTMKVGIDLAVRKQLSGERMDGTSELMILASLRVFGPRMVAQPQTPF